MGMGMGMGMGERHEELAGDGEVRGESMSGAVLP
jgi:hypothetical protein